MQLIFNNTSAGGNKVKINGLPPTERLNLIEYEGAYRWNNLTPFEIKKCFLKKGNTHYVLSNLDNCLYKFEIGKPSTKITNEINPFSIDFAFWQNGKLHVAKKDNYNIWIYRIDNGNLTQVMHITYNNLKAISNNNNIDSIKGFFNLENEFYIIADDINRNRYIFKNNKLNTNYTEITKQISVQSGAPLYILDEQYKKFIYKKVAYILDGNDKKIYKFDGKSFIEHKTINSATTFASEGSQCDEAPFLVLLKKSGTQKTYSIFKMEQKDGVNDFYPYKDFVHSNNINQIIVKNENTILYPTIFTNSKDFEEYPAILFRKE